MAQWRSYDFPLFLLAVISYGKLIVSAEAQPQYINSITQMGILPIQIKLCPNQHSRYGLFALSPPGTWYNVTAGMNDNLEIAFTITDNSSCVEQGQRYAFHVNFRSFHLSNGDRPLFQIGVEDPLNGDVDRRPDMRRLRNYTLGYVPHPRAELQYLTGYSSRPAFAIHIKLEAMRFDGVNQAVEMEYTVLQEHLTNDSTTARKDVVHCGALHGYMPRELYCLDHTSKYLGCPNNCETDDDSNEDDDDDDDHEDHEDGFLYGSCGRERESQKCGEAREIVLSGNVNDLPEGELNFVLGWDVLAGIIAGGVVLFVLCPIIVLCVAYYRGKKRH